MVFRPPGMSIYRGLGGYRPSTAVTSIPSSITVYKGLGGGTASATGQVGHGLGGLFRSLSKSVMPAAKGLISKGVTRKAPNLVRAGTQKLKRAATAGALKQLAGGKKAATNLLKGVSATNLMSIARKQAKKVVPKLVKQAKKKTAPTLLRSGLKASVKGILSDITSKKKKQASILKKGASQALSRLTKGLKRRAPNILTSFTPKVKRSKGVSFQTTSSTRRRRPAVVSTRRSTARPRPFGPRGRRRRRFHYKPARKLDIWEI